MNFALDFVEKFFLCSMYDKKLLKIFLENEPLPTNVQEKILNVTIKNPICKKYSPSLSYKKYFLRTLLDIVENCGSELSDDLIEAYTDIFVTHVEDEVSYRSYIINKDCVITLQESSCIVAKSTTGLQTWEAAKYLSEWCIENASNFRNKRILELGCGIGLLGLAILKLCYPQSYIFSDKSWEVLKTLCSNIKINIQDKLNHVIETQILVWSAVSTEDVACLAPDVIVGTDLVFDPAMIESLVHALKTFLHNGTTCAYIATAVRNMDTNKLFCEELGSAPLNFEIIPCDKKSIFVYDNSSFVILYKIYA